MTRRTGWTMAVAAVAALVPAVAGAQQAGNARDSWCKDSGYYGDRAQYCEVRELTMMPPSGVLTINAQPNGSISIRGWQQRDVAIRAKVTTQADTDEQAQTLARSVAVRAAGDTIASDGPARGEHEHWSVSYEVSVPFDHPLALRSTNGAISIKEMRSVVDFRTRNGSIALTNVGGRVKGFTQNGSLRVTLDDTRWQGDGLDIETHNGSVNLTVPDGFAAHLETSTVNGRVHVDFPITLVGHVDGRHISTDLNGGGAPIRVVTTNGSVSVRKR